MSGPPYVATIPWIEILLQTPMDGHRNFVMWHIITSYSINMRKLSYKESSHTIRQWLRKSNALSKLDFDGDQRVKVSQNLLLVSLSKLKVELPTLCSHIHWVDYLKTNQRLRGNKGRRR